jgi:maltose/moltooligosaccharide transporter
LGILCSIALFLSFSVVRYGWQQVCWVLDAEIIPRWNLIEHLLQTLKPAQQPTGFQAQSFFTGFGQTLANVPIPFPLVLLVQREITNLGFASFFLGAVCSIGSVWWSSYTTKENPPTEEN